MDTAKEREMNGQSATIARALIYDELVTVGFSKELICAMGDRDKDKDPDRMMRKADKLTKLSLTRWTSDWAAATPLYEQAGVLYKISKKTEKAKEAYERAAMGQERLSSPWHAGKHMETAGALAKELGNWAEVADFYKRACELFTEAGKPQPGAEALFKGAKGIEDALPDEAVKMYLDACGIYEEEGRDQMAFDTYRAATNLYLKTQRYTDAANMLLRWGLAADKCKAVQSQCKAYLSAVIVYLYAQDIRQAEQCQADCSHIEAFFNSEHNSCAEQLLRAYREGNAEEIQHAVKSSSTINHLDHMIIRLAKQLPTGDVTQFAGSSGVEGDDVGPPLDDEDLT